MNHLDERDGLPQGFGEDDPLERGKERVHSGQLVPVGERDRHVDRSPVVITIEQARSRRSNLRATSLASTLAPRISLAPSLTASCSEGGSLATSLSVWLCNSRSIAVVLELGVSLGLDHFIINDLPDLALRLQECLVRALAVSDEQTLGDLHDPTPSQTGLGTWNGLASSIRLEQTQENQ